MGEDEQQRDRHHDLRRHQREQHQEVRAARAAPAPAGQPDRQQDAERRRDHHVERRQLQALRERVRVGRRRGRPRGRGPPSPPAGRESLPDAARAAVVEREAASRSGPGRAPRRCRARSSARGSAAGPRGSRASCAAAGRPARAGDGGRGGHARSLLRRPRGRLDVVEHQDREDRHQRAPAPRRGLLRAALEERLICCRACLVWASRRSGRSACSSRRTSAGRSGPSREDAPARAAAGSRAGRSGTGTRRGRAPPPAGSCRSGRGRRTPAG